MRLATMATLVVATVTLIVWIVRRAPSSRAPASWLLAGHTQARYASGCSGGWYRCLSAVCCLQSYKAARRCCLWTVQKKPNHSMETEKHEPVVCCGKAGKPGATSRYSTCEMDDALRLSTQPFRQQRDTTLYRARRRLDNVQRGILSFERPKTGSAVFRCTNCGGQAHSLGRDAGSSAMLRLRTRECSRPDTVFTNVSCHGIARSTLVRLAGLGVGKSSADQARTAVGSPVSAAGPIQALLAGYSTMMPSLAHPEGQQHDVPGARSGPRPGWFAVAVARGSLSI